MKPTMILTLAAGALFACGRAGSADEVPAPVEAAGPALHTAAAGAQIEARPVQFVSASPYGYTWYGSGGYVYEPTSFYVVPYYYGPSWYSSYYAPDAYYTSYRPYSTSYRPYYTSYQPYSVAEWPYYGYGTGWLPYAYHYRPYGSFYNYYGPAYGSGFHLWFGY